MALGRADDSWDAFEAAGKRHSNAAAVLRNYRNMLWKAGRRAQAEADAAYFSAVADGPRLANARLNLGLIPLEQGSHNDAEDALTAAHSLDPRHVGAWSTLGAVRIERDLLEDALQCLDRELSIDPRHLRSQARRGKAIGLLGRFGEALGALSPLDSGPHATALGDVASLLQEADPFTKDSAPLLEAKGDLAFRSARPNVAARAARNCSG